MRYGCVTSREELKCHLPRQVTAHSFIKAISIKYQFGYAAKHKTSRPFAHNLSDTRDTWGNAVGACDEASLSSPDTSSDICILGGRFWVSSPLSLHWINVTECNYIRDLIQCWRHGRDGSCQKKWCWNSSCSLDRPTTSSLAFPSMLMLMNRNCAFRHWNLD